MRIFILGLGLLGIAVSFVLVACSDTTHAVGLEELSAQAVDREADSGIEGMGMSDRDLLVAGVVKLDALETRFEVETQAARMALDSMGLAGLDLATLGGIALGSGKGVGNAQGNGNSQGNEKAGGNGPTTPNSGGGTTARGVPHQLDSRFSVNPIRASVLRDFLNVPDHSREPEGRVTLAYNGSFAVVRHSNLLPLVLSAQKI